MDIPLDEVIYFDVITTNPSTGAVSDADSTPTFEVFEEATDTDIGVGGNLTKRTSKTGNYRGTFTISAANGFEVGKWYNVICSATVNSVSGKVAAKHFRVVAAEQTAGYPGVNVTHVANTEQTAGNIITTLGTPEDTSIATDLANLKDAVAAVFSVCTYGYGVATSGSSTTVVFAADGVWNVSLPSAADLPNGSWVAIVGGTGRGQTALILDYAVSGGSATVTIEGPWVTNPTSGSVVALIPAGKISGIYGNTNQTGDSYAIVNSGTHGNAALKTLIDTVDDLLDTEVAAIKAKTDNLPSDPADASDIASSFSTVNSTLSTISGYLDTEIAAIKAVTDGLNTLLSTTGIALTAAERNAVADALLDRTNGIETSVTPRQALRAIASLLCGIISGGGTGTEVFKAIAAASGGTTRVTVTVDEDGNRSAVTLNL